MFGRFVRSMVGSAMAFATKQRNWQIERRSKGKSECVCVCFCFCVSVNVSVSGWIKWIKLWNEDRTSLSKWINAEQIENSFNKEAQIASGHKFISPCLIMGTERICPSSKCGKSIKRMMEVKMNKKKKKKPQPQHQQRRKLYTQNNEHKELFCSASNR